MQELFILSSELVSHHVKLVNQFDDDFFTFQGFVIHFEQKTFIFYD